MRGMDQVLDTLSQALAGAPGDEADLVYVGGRSGTTRFAQSSIHQNTVESSDSIFARVCVGKRIGVVSATSFTREDLSAALASAAELARVTPETPYWPGLADPATYGTANAHDAATAACTPTQRAAVLQKVFALGAASGVGVDGAFTTTETEIAVANTRGVRAYHPLTTASIQIIPTLPDSSGYASGASTRLADLNVEALTEKAIEKCLRGKNPIEVKPGKWTVVLEPQAVADLFTWLGFIGFTAKALREGHSFLCGRMGERVMSEQVSVYDDGLDPAGIPLPFDFEGVPKRKVALMEKGIGRAVCHDRLTAARDGVQTTGHATPPGRGSEGAAPLNLFMAAGDSSVGEMIAGTEKGLLITRWHYLNGLIQPREAVFTGMTRDGTFLIENGKLGRGIKNLRFTETLVGAFSRIQAVSRERKLVGATWSPFGAYVMPAMKIEGFTFTDATDH